ncbi:MAG: leucine--tRNA ligase [Actinomycetota bacterium]|nr:leucine--tRNA ligase [Actinomycetota bacterium]
MVGDYDFTAIEDRYQRAWIEADLWAAPELPDPDRKRYLVTMFPYPSGDLHMGHVEIFSIQDAIARFHRMRGYDVLNPIGWDAFGLPAENAAIRRGINPKKWTYDNIAKHRASMERLGLSFDWNRVFLTCEADYFKWNQWFFLQFYERGLAYRKQAAAWWCPNDKTVLANEQVIAGRCERCGAEVVRRYPTQWFFKITDYADRLVDDLEFNVGWSEHLKMLQRNWIGRSYGAEVDFALEGIDEPVTVFTTRPDTLWGATFFVMAPEHPLAAELVAGTPVEAELDAFKEEVSRMSEIDRASTERPKKGLSLERFATNPVNGERIPIWVADYVLMDYGTGAIMAVPAHDQRDFEFARSNELEIRVVIEPPGESLDPAQMTEAYPHDGVMVNSGEFDGTPATESVARVTEWLEAKGLGRAAKNFRLRDWLISRQRYWGTPIPILYCEDCGEVPVPEADLPVELPDDVDFNPTGEESPLATAHEWVNTTCPKCGGAARRETDTMDTFVDSAWYFLRYLDPHNSEAPFRAELANAWMPMDRYTGGITHGVMHLIYARFFQKVLMDMGMVDSPEPFPRVLNQGMVTMDGKSMSKSRGNIVEPVEAFERYGADALRLYMLFSGPPEQDFDWPHEGVEAIGRVSFPWLRRVWRLCEDVRAIPKGDESLGPVDLELRKAVHKTIKVVTRDYEALSFNTAIARMQELVNEAYRYRGAGGSSGTVLTELVEALLRLLAPIAPYITEEQWHRYGHGEAGAAGPGETSDSIHMSSWPDFDEQLATESTVTMVIQVNGKVRDTLDVAPSITEEEMRERALASEKIQGYLGGKDPLKVIVKPPRLISLVLK